MKKSFVFFTILFLIACNICFSQSWVTQNSGTTYTLNCLYFINANTGWAAGNGGIILKTTNGGENWTAQNSGIPYILNGVFFTDASTGYISGYSGIVLKTTNAGGNWVFSNNGISNLHNLYKIKFVNGNTGFTSGTGGKIYKTVNAGAVWDTVFSFYSQYYTTYDMLFADENTGWSCQGSNYIYRTSNGGYNWTLAGGGGAGYHSRSITKSQYFVWVCREYAGDLERSDNGVSFYHLNNNLNITCYTISFLNDYTGYAAGNGGIKKSTNSGENWTTDYTETGTTFYSLFTFNTDNMWCAGSGGRIVAKKQPTGIQELNENITCSYTLYENYPNPFNQSTVIRYRLPKTANVRITIFDIWGKEITELMKETKPAGSYEIRFDAGRFSSGIYFYRLFADGKTIEVKRMMLVK